MGRSGEKIDLSGTHLPVLAKVLIGTDGAVLELGAGLNSTPLLYWHCKAYDRVFRSFENDKKWCDKLGSITQYIDDWDKIDFDEFFWSFILIDHRPALRRHKDAIALKKKAQFVILHDSEPEIDRFYAYRRIWPHYKYRYDFKRIKPYTTIVSNFIDPQKHFHLT